MRRWVGLIAGLALAGCYDETQLEGLECINDDDCWPTQQCVRTPTQLERGLNGACRPDATCQPGAQLGCNCLVGDVQASCMGTLVASDPSNAETCICCNSEEMVEDNAMTLRVCVEPSSESGSSGGG